MPETGPFGEIFREASVRAITEALFVNRPSGGCVESLVTRATQRRGFFLREELLAVMGPSRLILLGAS